MSMSWRVTLETLLAQFQTAASRSQCLHHMLVEVADDERDKLTGPEWFNPYESKIRFVDGQPQYGKWDLSKSTFLPGISPGFREPNPDEKFDEKDSGRVVKDLSGVVRAVKVPMTLRQGFYCGVASDIVSSFESLADAAASAIAGSSNLDEHVFGSDLSDIFRHPRGGVRYLFGDVPVAPEHFIAQGWQAGVLAFPAGVLIDVPISESMPNASNWVLMLHRLGWRHVDGSALRARRFAWEGTTEVALELLTHGEAGSLAGASERFAKISRYSFYSILGTKDAPLDVNLASVFAIQMLLSDLSTKEPQKEQARDAAVDYTKEKWKHLVLPALRVVNEDEALEACTPRVGILVATDVEKDAVLKKMRPPANKRGVLQVYSGRNTYYLGRLGVTNVVLCMTAMGSSGRDASTIVTVELIQAWKPAAVIMVGIAFGKDATKQRIGTVLVSDKVLSYEQQRIGKDSSEDRGNEPLAGTVLLNRFRNVVGWDFKSPDGQKCSFQVGPVLSGEKLVDNVEFKNSLFDRFPTAIGGEMEGAGVAASAARNGCEWIVVKGICDWGDGSKTKVHQEFAAAASIDLVEHVLNQLGALDSL